MFCVYLKITQLNTSLIINSMDVSSLASKHELRVNLFSAVGVD